MDDYYDDQEESEEEKNVQGIAILNSNEVFQ
jgi:hypothetical protein